MPSASEFKAAKAECDRLEALAKQAKQAHADATKAAKEALCVQAEALKVMRDAKLAHQRQVDVVGGLICDAELEREELLATEAGNAETALARCEDLPMEILLKIYYAYIKQTDFKEMRDKRGCKFTLRVPWYDRVDSARMIARSTWDGWVDMNHEDIRIKLHIKATHYTKYGNATWGALDTIASTSKSTAYWYATKSDEGDDVHHALYQGIQYLNPTQAQMKKFTKVCLRGDAELWRVTACPRHYRYEAVDINGEVIPKTAINILKPLRHTNDEGRNQSYLNYRIN